MIRFSRYIPLYFAISLLVIVPGCISLLVNGLKPAIDFTGGTLLELHYPSKISTDAVVKILTSVKVSPSSVAEVSGNDVIVRLRPESPEKLAAVEKAFAAQKPPAEIVRNETVGPVLGKELLRKTITAAIFAVIVILLYVAYAFKNIKFGVSAIIALLHDLLVVLGVFSLLGKFANVEVDTLFVTAVLTTMSFSVHDTIVVFDRVRELRKRGEKLHFEALCDKALTQTIGRSVANSFTIIFMLFALVLLGGENIRWFVLALLIGTVSGTYSSPFVATPVLILWDRYEKKKRQ